MISFLNGIISLVDLGLTECYGGFGETGASECSLLEDYYDNSGDDYSHGKLKYQPSNPNNAGSVVDELSLLLTAGRLNSESRSLIVDAFEGEANNAAGIRVAQKLMASIPEFHSTTLFENLSQSRPETETPEVSSKRYKAVCNGLFFDR